MSSIQYSQPNSLGDGPSGDPISQLPVDQSQPSNNELQIVNSLFTKHKSTMDTLVEEAKDSVLIGALFIAFSLPLVDGLIEKGSSRNREVSLYPSGYQSINCDGTVLVDQALLPFS